MKKIMLVLVVLSMIFTSINVTCGEMAAEEKTAPYFFVKSDDPGVEAFPLLKTRAKVNIAGIVAEVELVQVYKNDGKKTIEAVYIFPLGIRAAIHKMKMKIGEREINAVIEEKKTAKAIYDKAKQDGKVASLLQQERPNVFQMNVANIMPGDIVEVTVNYTELLVPEGGVYEYVFPTVVGPRYNAEVDKSNDGDGWIKTPYSHEDEDPAYDFDIEINLRTGIPLNKVWTPSHSTKIIKDIDMAKVRLSQDETKGGNRDFILRYTLEGNEIQTGLLLYPGKDENFFLLMAQPPKKVRSKDIPPREYVFIVDVSGSMSGYPLDISKKLIRRIIRNLRGKDYFNILFFAGGSDVLSKYPLPATKENVKKAIAMLDAQDGSGSTNMLAAVKRALSLEKKEGLSRSVVVITDGYISVEKEVFDLIRERLSEANFFTFGIGTSVNRYLIEGMARVGKGKSFVTTDRKEAAKVADKFLEYVSQPLLTDIKVNFNGFDVYDVEPVNIPDLFAKRPLIIYGKYRKAAGKISITGKTAREDYIREIKVEPYLEDKNNNAIKYLWAREKIADLSDYGQIGVEVKEEITALGLKYSLMTEYTAFIAVDTVTRETGETVTVKQPLPLPEGVSDYAISEAASSGSAYYSGQVACARVMPMYESYDISVGDHAAKQGYGTAEYYYKEDASAGYRYEEGATAGYRQDIVNVYLTGGKFPKGLTMDYTERLLKPLKERLEKLFNEWGLRKICLVLNLEKGIVRSIQIKSYEGEIGDQADLETLLKGVSFPHSATGAVELELSLL